MIFLIFKISLLLIGVAMLLHWAYYVDYEPEHNSDSRSVFPFQLWVSVAIIAAPLYLEWDYRKAYTEKEVTSEFRKQSACVQEKILEKLKADELTGTISQHFLDKAIKDCKTEEKINPQTTSNERLIQDLENLLKKTTSRD